MPQFRIEGDSRIFEHAEDIAVKGEIGCYSFVTADHGEHNDVVLTPVELKDLANFEGILFQVDVDQDEDTIVLRQVQMFFWPWEDDEEFEGMDSPDDEPEIA